MPPSSQPCAAEEQAPTVDERKTLLRSFTLLRGPVAPALAQAVNLTAGSFVLTMSTVDASCQLDNFMQHWAASSEHDLLVANMDRGSHAHCRNIRQRLAVRSRGRARCADLSGWLPQPQRQTQMLTPHYNVSDHYGSCYYRLLMWAKPVVFWQALSMQKGFGRHDGVLYVDNDVLFKRDLIGYIKANVSVSKVLATATWGNFKPWPAAGVVFARDAGGRAMLRRLVDECTHSNGPRGSGFQGDNEEFRDLVTVKIPYMRPVLQLLSRHVVG